jgi:putative endonuclease
MPVVYILKSKKNNRYYIGSTEDFQRRFAQHQNGNVKSTKNLRPWIVVLAQEYSSIKEARIIEKKLKALKRRDYLDKIVTEGTIKMRT